MTQKLKMVEWYCKKLQYCLFEDLQKVIEMLGHEIVLMYESEGWDRDEHGWNDYYIYNIRVKRIDVDNESINYYPILIGYGFELREIAD